MREQRRLAAIVSADVAGYSRLMGRDESGTLAALKAARREVVDPPIAAHGGRIVKTTGDGLLLEFPSVVDAVRCVIEVQTAMAARGGDIAFRIGVNLGDIIIDGDDIFGDGVNIAARLQEIAPPGGLCVSSRVHDDIRDRLDAAFENGGSQTLKNIARPVQVWRWSPSGTAAAAAPPSAEAPLALPDKPSIAVLPFQNMSGDPEQEYFADGMVEDIITALSRFKSLFVIARNSSFTYKGKAVDIKRVGRELGVRYVLEGSVRKGGGKVRITGQLIDAETGAHLWADRFEGSLEDLFELQDRITTSVVGAIAPMVEQAEIERSRRKPPGNLSAYDCLLRGRWRKTEGSFEGAREALALFYRAIELDPGFALAYALAANCYVDLRTLGGAVDKDREDAEVRRLVGRAVILGRDDAVALCVAGIALVVVCRDYETGGSLIEQGLAINTNLASGWANRGWLSLWIGQYEASLEQLAQALRLSPLATGTLMAERGMALAHLEMRHYGEALKWAKSAYARNTDNLLSIRHMAAIHARAGNIDEARKFTATLLQRDPTTNLSKIRKSIPFRDPAAIEHLIESLRLAGMPE